MKIVEKILSGLVLSVLLSCDNSDNEVVWFTETDQFTGTFNPKLYTKKQIEDTEKLCVGHFGSYNKTGLHESEGVLDATEIRTKTALDILNDRNENKTKIENLALIQQKFWIELKDKKLKEVEDEFRLQEIVLKAYTNPTVLLDNEFAKLCPEFVAIANTSDTTKLLESWERLFEGKEYGDKNIHNFYTKYKTQVDRYLNARADIITFGYWHCTCEKLAISNGNNSLEELNKLVEEFNKLFVEIKQERW